MSPWSVRVRGVSKAEVVRIAADAVHEHEAHDHPGKAPTHVTVVSHADGRHVVHNDHTGHSETHESAAKARAAARDMRKG